MTSALENLVGPGKALKREPPDANEFEGLKRSAFVRLDDEMSPALSVESRFDLAYNAAHALCLAALRWHGYRSTNRYVVFQVLPMTLGLGPEIWRVLAKCHNVRNLGEYEGDLSVDERIVEDLMTACQSVAKQVRALSTIQQESSGG